MRAGRAWTYANSKIYFPSQWKLYNCNRRINAHMSIKDSWALSFVRENSSSSCLILCFFFLTAKRRFWSILIVLLNISRVRRRWYSHLYWLIRVSGKYPLKTFKKSNNWFRKSLEGQTEASVSCSVKPATDSNDTKPSFDGRSWKNWRPFTLRDGPLLDALS